MTCGKKHSDNAPTEATKVDPAEVEGRPLCDRPGCDKRVVGEGRECAAGHVQGQGLSPAELPALFRAVAEWRQSSALLGEAGRQLTAKLDLYAVKMQFAGKPGFEITVDTTQGYYDEGAHRLRKAVEFLEGQGESWASDPRVQAARSFIEENRQVRSLPEIMEMEERAVQTAAFRELVGKAHAVDVPDLVAALVDRQRSGSLLRTLQERYPELVTEELLGLAQFLITGGQPLDRARLTEIVTQLTEKERGTLLEQCAGVAPAQFGAVVAVVAPHLEHPETALVAIQRYNNGGQRDAAAQSSGQAQALAALAPHLAARHVAPVVDLLEGGKWTDRAGRNAACEVLMQIAADVPANLVYRTVEVGRLVGADPPIGNFPDEWPRRLARAEIAEELLFAVQQNGRVNDYFRSALLQATYPYLQEDYQWRRAWRTLSTLRRGEDKAWAELAAALPAALSGELLSEMPTTLAPDTRQEVCAILAPRCPAEHWAVLMAQVGTLNPPSTHEHRKAVVGICTATPAAGWSATLSAVEQMCSRGRGSGAPLLAAFIGQVPADQVGAACELALRMADDVDAATRVFAQLGPRLSSEQAAHAVRTAWQEYQQMQAQDSAASRGGYAPRRYADSERGNVLAHSVLHPELAARLPPEAMADAVALLGHTPYDRLRPALLAMLPRMPAAVLPKVADWAHRSLDRRYYHDEADLELGQRVQTAVRARAQELGVDLDEEAAK